MTVVETREQRRERRKKERSEQVWIIQIFFWGSSTNFTLQPGCTCYHTLQFWQVAYKLEQEIALWDPNAVLEATSDPFKTLFVARVNFYTRYLTSKLKNLTIATFTNFSFSSESKLKREFEQYGTVKSIRMVMSTKDTKPRGYAFIEYEHEKDMHCKYLM